MALTANSIERGFVTCDSMIASYSKVSPSSCFRYLGSPLDEEKTHFRIKLLQRSPKIRCRNKDKVKTQGTWLIIACNRKISLPCTLLGLKYILLAT